MTILTDPTQLSEIPGPICVAIGVFDGVHLGHQAVLRRARDDARALGGAAAAITFDPHPVKILRPGAAPHLLTSTPHKLQLISQLGFPFALVIPFDAKMASTPAKDFLAALYQPTRQLHEIVVGCGWAFGKNREGSVQLIRETGQRENFLAVEIPAVTSDGEPVSSTRIRRAIEVGDFESAATCLGRPYSILGTVIPGNQIGRTLGFPTANLRAHNEQFPPNGVYAVRATVSGKLFDGVANIGVRPTISSQGERLLEVHLLHFHQDIYGQDMEVTFVSLLRHEQSFGSLEALKAQISSDITTATTIFEASGH
ncbi:MAG: bifunctional riboflavin kinase/FAD synthetase [Terrimicrobiaceae bacterium]